MIKKLKLKIKKLKSLIRDYKKYYKEVSLKNYLKLKQDSKWYYDYVNDLQRKHSKRVRNLRKEIKALKTDMEIYEKFIEARNLEKDYQEFIDDNIENIIKKGGESEYL